MTNLTASYNKVTSSVDVGQAVDVVYLSFTKAFYTICHCLLLENSMYDGPEKMVCGVGWNWLSGSTQRRVGNSSFSNWQPVTRGVTQRPILSLKLFSIFISDLNDKNKCTLMRCDDDTKLSGTGHFGRESHPEGRHG